MEINFIPVNEKNIDTYIEVGIKSYKEHYLHLWKNQDPSPFINAFLNKAFIIEALKSTTHLFYLIKADSEIFGILNVSLNSEKGFFLSKENLLLNKIYILKAYTEKGIGTSALKFTENLAIEMKKDVVWLFAMKKGKPLKFYLKHNYTIIKEALVELPHILENEKEMWLMAKKV